MSGLTLLLLAQLVDPTLSIEEVATSTNILTGIARALDGSDRMFITEKTGRVRLVESGVMRAEPFAEIRPIHTNRESGLVGIALDPGFAENHFVYVFVTTGNREQQILRFTDQGGVGVDRTTIVSGIATLGTKHNGGGLGVGLDYAIYFGVGDNGPSAGADQDLVSLASKIGRAGRDGSAPFDNPFVDGEGPNHELIWARGFRNPFTLTFRPIDGALWVSSVGEAYDQIFVVSRGDHAGWNDYENNQPPGFLAPVIKYRPRGVDTATITADGAERAGGVARFTSTADHGLRRGERITVSGVADASFDGVYFVRAVLGPRAFEVVAPGADADSGGGRAVTDLIGGSVTGGTFYDGTALPPEYWDDYLFPDFVSNRISVASLDENGQVDRVEAMGVSTGNLTDMEVGADGSVWFINYRGAVRRIRASAAEQRILVPQRHPWWVEEHAGALPVSLALPPTGTVTIDVRSLDGRVQVLTPELRFDGDDHAIPKVVRVVPDPDLDGEPTPVVLELSLEGAAPLRIDAWILDRVRAAPPDAGLVAMDAMGAELRREDSTVGDVSEPTSDLGGASSDAGSDAEEDASGCDCRGGAPASERGGVGLLLALLALGLSRARRARAERA